MPSLIEVSDFIYSNLDKVTTTKNGTHFNARCPICGDSKKSEYKKRFHLQFYDDDYTEWHCFNCDESGSFYKLHAYIEGITEEESYNLYNKYDKDRIENRLKRRKKRDEKKEKKKGYSDFTYILNDCVSLDNECDGHIQKQYQKKLKEFVEDRKVTQKLYIAYKGDYKSRIIIPVWYRDNIIYFQGRRIYDDMEPKYLNPTAYKSNIILNVENFDRSKYIVVTEGILDAYSVGDQGTSILGKEIQKDLIDRIRQHTDKGIIIAMDNDGEGLKKSLDSLENFKKDMFFFMPEKYINVKDINKLLSDLYINRDDVYKFIVDNSFSQLKYKSLITNGNRMKKIIKLGG